MTQTLLITQTPVAQDAADGVSYWMGTYMTPAVRGTVDQVGWFKPLTAQPADEAVLASVMRVSDSFQMTDTASFSVPGDLGAWNWVDIDPVVWEAGIQYCPVIRTPLRYVASSGVDSPWPLTNGDLSAPSSAGRFSTPAGPTPVLPTNSFNNGCYFVDVRFTPDSPDPSEGSADFSLNLAVAAGGARQSAGAAGLGLGLSPSAAGARRSAGAAALGMNLAVAAAGRRSSAGAAALGLRFTVDAHGSNGAVGRPVSAWPFPQRDISGYPWTPRPVRSFTEVPEP